MELPCGTAELRGRDSDRKGHAWSQRKGPSDGFLALAEAEPRDEPPAMGSLGEEEASVSRTDGPALLKKPGNRPLVTHRLSSQFPEAKERKFSANLVH